MSSWLSLAWSTKKKSPVRAVTPAVAVSPATKVSKKVTWTEDKKSIEATSTVQLPESLAGDQSIISNALTIMAEDAKAERISKEARAQREEGRRLDSETDIIEAKNQQSRMEFLSHLNLNMQGLRDLGVRSMSSSDLKSSDVAPLPVRPKTVAKGGGAPKTPVTATATNVTEKEPLPTPRRLDGLDTPIVDGLDTPIDDDDVMNASPEPDGRHDDDHDMDASPPKPAPTRPKPRRSVSVPVIQPEKDIFAELRTLDGKAFVSDVNALDIRGLLGEPIEPNNPNFHRFVQLCLEKEAFGEGTKGLSTKILVLMRHYMDGPNNTKKYTGGRKWEHVVVIKTWFAAQNQDLPPATEPPAIDPPAIDPPAIDTTSLSDKSKQAKREIAMRINKQAKAWVDQAKTLKDIPDPRRMKAPMFQAIGPMY